MMIKIIIFSTACYTTLHPALSVRPSAGPSVRPSVRLSHFTSVSFLRSLASLLLPKCSGNSNTAPAHSHATGVAVYSALFCFLHLCPINLFKCNTQYDRYKAHPLIGQWLNFLVQNFALPLLRRILISHRK